MTDAPAPQTAEEPITVEMTPEAEATAEAPPVEILSPSPPVAAETPKAEPSLAELMEMFKAQKAQNDELIRLVREEREARIAADKRAGALATEVAALKAQGTDIKAQVTATGAQVDGTVQERAAALEGMVNTRTAQVKTAVGDVSTKVETTAGDTQKAVTDSAAEVKKAVEADGERTRQAVKDRANNTVGEIEQIVELDGVNTRDRLRTAATMMTGAIAAVGATTVAQGEKTRETVEKEGEKTRKALDLEITRTQGAIYDLRTDVEELNRKIDADEARDAAPHVLTNKADILLKAGKVVDDLKARTFEAPTVAMTDMAMASHLTMGEIREANTAAGGINATAQVTHEPLTVTKTETTLGPAYSYCDPYVGMVTARNHITTSVQTDGMVHAPELNQNQHIKLDEGDLVRTTADKLRDGQVITVAQAGENDRGKLVLTVTDKDKISIASEDGNIQVTINGKTATIKGMKLDDVMLVQGKLGDPKIPGLTVDAGATVVTATDFKAAQDARVAAAREKFDEPLVTATRERDNAYSAFASAADAIDPTGTYTASDKAEARETLAKVAKLAGGDLNSIPKAVADLLKADSRFTVYDAGAAGVTPVTPPAPVVAPPVTTSVVPGSK